MRAGGLGLGRTLAAPRSLEMRVGGKIEWTVEAGVSWHVSIGKWRGRI
jgi:hypothetical protein